MRRNKEPNKTLGERLRALREDSDMRQEDLGRLLSVSRNAVAAYENGSVEISASMLTKLCNIFGVTADYLLGFEDTYTVSLDGLSPAHREIVLRLVQSLKED